MDEKLKSETYDANNTPMIAEELVKRIRSKVRDCIKIKVLYSHKNAKIQNCCISNYW